MSKKYKNKQLFIEAVQFKGKENQKECQEFVGESCIKNGFYDVIVINSLEGKISVNVGDYIIKDANEECYACPSNIFESIYILIDEDTNKYRSKINIIDAIEYNGTVDNALDVRKFVGFAHLKMDIEILGNGKYYCYDNLRIVHSDREFKVSMRDFIIRINQNECYTCPPITFNKIFEKIN